MKTILEIKNISKIYDKTVVALSNVSFKIEYGITAITGPNGAGKTTLFNIISGTVKASSGEIRFLGKRINGYQPHKRCMAGIGRTFQIPRLFDENSLLENVAIGVMTGAKKIKENMNIDSLKKQAGEILNFIGIKENKYEIKAKKLTLAEQKMLQLATAVATKPKLMLIDELSSGMTFQDALRLSDVIKRLYDYGISFLMVEHNMELINKLAEKIIVLHEGQIVNVSEKGDNETRK